MESTRFDFSVVIPTYNRPERLEQCLRSIADLDYARENFEVIVVDDGSYMPMAPVIEKFKDSFTLNLIRQSNAGPASARNTGAAAAKGNTIVFTDDDCRPDANWLKTIAAARKDDPQALIGGRTLNALPGNVFSTASQLLIDYLYDYYNQGQVDSMFFASNNFAVPRDEYQKLSGFDTSFPLAAGEDREFCDRWQHHGLPMRYAPRVKIHHAHSLTLSSFWRQHFNYGRGAFCFHQIRGQRQSQPMKVEPINFYLQLLAYPISREQGVRGLVISSLFVLSQFANVTGFFWESSKSNSL